MCELCNDNKVCDICCEEKDSTVLRIDPFDADVNNEQIERYICDECYEQLCDDI